MLPKRGDRNCLVESLANKKSIERASLSPDKLSIGDDIVTYTTKDGTAHACLAAGGSSTVLSPLLNSPATSRKPSSLSLGTMEDTPAGAEVAALNSPHLRNRRSPIAVSPVGVVGPGAQRESTSMDDYFLLPSPPHSSRVEASVPFTTTQHYAF